MNVARNTTRLGGFTSSDVENRSNDKHSTNDTDVYLHPGPPTNLKRSEEKKQNVKFDE